MSCSYLRSFLFSASDSLSSVRVFFDFPSRRPSLLRFSPLFFVAWFVSFRRWSPQGAVLCVGILPLSTRRFRTPFRLSRSSPLAFSPFFSEKFQSFCRFFSPFPAIRTQPQTIILAVRRGRPSPLPPLYIAPPPNTHVLAEDNPPHSFFPLILLSSYLQFLLCSASASGFFLTLIQFPPTVFTSPRALHKDLAVLYAHWKSSCVLPDHRLHALFFPRALANLSSTPCCVFDWRRGGPWSNVFFPSPSLLCPPPCVLFLFFARRGLRLAPGLSPYFGG